MIQEGLSYIQGWTWLWTAFIGLVTFLLVKHILKVRSLPPGPFPWPFIGNITEFRGKDTDGKEVLNEFCRKYKDIFTFWMGPNPTIFVCSWELCKEALVVKRNDFSGRIKRASAEIIWEGHQNVISGDFGPCWETLRKIITAAVRKFSVSEKLAEVSADLVDRAADRMLKEGKPVDSSTYIYLIILNILGSSAFGERYELDDPEFLKLKKTNDDMNEVLAKGIPSDFIPILKWFYSKREQELARVTGNFKSFIGARFNQHKVTYQKGIVRDFTDAVLAARQEAEEEGLDKLEYLTDGNMKMVLLDFFMAGIDTTKTTLNWLLLFICEHQDVQRKIQGEIDEHLGSRIPYQSDRAFCPYTNSVITELLRIRPFVDFSLEHKATRDTELGGYKIPKGSGILFAIRCSQTNNEFWDEPKRFKPERFLEPDGSFSQARMSGYLPFGIGRRACPGEKLALADIFLVIVRLLQNHSLELENGIGSVKMTPKLEGFANFPESYNVVIKKREKQ